MFNGCTNIKLSQTQSDEYQTSYRIPYTGDGVDASEALVDMFANTGGTFTGTPTINTTYYGAWMAENDLINVSFQTANYSIEESNMGESRSELEK
jgi:hypothetical protein